MLTDLQAKYLESLERHGGNKTAVAREFGKDPRGVARQIEAAQMKLARQGHSPAHDMTHTAPEGFTVKGVSTLYGADGEITAQWVKTQQDREAEAQIMQAVVDAMAEDIPKTAPVPAPKKGNADLLNCFVVTDYHLGMKAWGEETGADWDTGIAEKLLIDWFATAIKSAPKADEAVFAQLGDFLHWDGQLPLTPASGHVLDADTRYQHVVRVAIRVIRRVTHMLLKSHQRVHLVMAEGNHDPASSVWLREFFHTLFEDEPRVTVDLSPDPYYCVEHGKTSLFFHHGHKRKVANVDTVLTAKFRDVFGRTEHSYAHMGHLHHDRLNETNLMLVEQHRTLASPDAYASRGGWMSGRSAKVITYHKQHGEVGRVTVTPEMAA